MNAITQSPKELPNVNEEASKSPEIKEGFLNQIPTEQEELTQLLGQPYVDIDFSDNNIPKLTLSGKRNIKKLRNWMFKHMEAYPEIKHGFIVEFNGDTSNKIFIVRPCREDEDLDITINWIDYRIIEKTLKIDPIDEIKERTELEVNEEILYPTADKTPEEQMKNGLDTIPTGSDTWIDTDHYKKELIKVFEDSGRIDD